MATVLSTIGLNSFLRGCSYLAGAGFLYNGEEHSAIVVHQGGYLTFNGSTSNGELDCLNATTFEGQDIIVALCTAKMLTLVSERALTIPLKAEKRLCL